MQQNIKFQSGGLVKASSTSNAKALEILQDCNFSFPINVTGKIRKAWEINHDDTMAYKCFPHYWPFVRGIHWSLADYLHKGPVMWTLDIFKPKQAVEQIAEL